MIALELIQCEQLLIGFSYNAVIQLLHTSVANSDPQNPQYTRSAYLASPDTEVRMVRRRAERNSAPNALFATETWMRSNLAGVYGQVWGGMFYGVGYSTYGGRMAATMLMKSSNTWQSHKIITHGDIDVNS